MREIKFRAWREETQHMFHAVLEIDFVEEWVTIWGKIIGESYFWLQELVLLQYTGLKDRYGTEIYEGDILELCENYPNEEGRVFQVVFKDGGFGDERGNYIGQYLPEDIKNKQGERVRLNEACEVIGNIYENKELLKDIK